MSELNDAGTEKFAEKLDETSATARTDPLRHAADSNSQDKFEQNAQKVTRRLPRVRNRTRRPALRSKVPLFDDSGKLNEIVSATTRTDALMTALPHVADSNSQDKSGHNAQKMTLDLIQRKGTQLPTLGMGASFLLGSYVEKDEDKPMESYSNEVLIYLALLL